ncbi:MAG TPA: HEAT repeat domain-containing protein [Aldersonia sp.]
MRRTATETLADRDGPAVTDALLTLSQDQDEWVRRTATKALADRDGPAVTDALLTLSQDQNDDVRRTATKALAGRVDTIISEWFRRIAADEDPRDLALRYAAAIAIAHGSRTWPHPQRDELLAAIATFTRQVAPDRMPCD